MLATEYDLAKPLASAIKAKAPFVGVPVPGSAPLIFRRAKLKAALAGVTPFAIGVRTDGNARWLTVEGHAGPRVRTKMSIPAIHPRYFKTYDGVKEMDRWTAQMRKTPAAAKTSPEPRGLKTKLATLAKLERELAKTDAPKRPLNPTVFGGYPRSMNEHTTAQMLSWRSQRRLRTVIGALAKECSQAPAKHRPSRMGKRHYLPSSATASGTTQLYAKLRDLGLTFKRYSDLDSREQDRVKDVWGYLAKLWEFCGLTSKPYEYGHPDKDYDFQRDSDSGFMEKVSLWGPARYYPYLAALNQRRSLQSQIDSIRVLINPAAAVTPEPPSLTTVLQIEKFKTAEANLASARAALEEFKAKLAVWADGREFDHWGRNEREPYGYYDRRNWAEWRQNRKARGIQWKRRQDRQPELDALYQAMRAIEPPFSGKGSMRKLTPAEADAVRMLRERRATIEGEIEKGTGAVLDGLSFTSPKYPYGRGHRPDLVTLPSRKDRARELGSILRRIRTAETALKTVRKPDLREAA